MFLRIIFLLLVVLTAFLGAHYLLYHSLVRFFSIESGSVKTVIAYALIFLASSFFLASALAHWKETFLTRMFYIGSGFWMGLLVNLFLACALGWLIIYMAGTFGQNQTNPLIFAALLLGAVGLSVYGTWNAFNPRIKNVELKIASFPESWKDKKIVQISDVHLGHVYKADFAQKIADMVNAQKPDVVFITGDLFDGMDGALESLAEPFNRIEAPDGIYFVTGNHETYLGLDKALSFLYKTKIRILDNEMLELDGVQLIGVSYPNAGEMYDVRTIFEKLKGYDPQKPALLLHHVPFDIDQAKDLKIDWQLSGHTHKGQMFPFGIITKLVYRGYDYGLFQEDGFTLYASNGVGTWGPPMRTGNSPEVVTFKLR